MIQEHLEKQGALEKLRAMVNEARVGMFTTVHTDHSVHTRPMQTIYLDGEKNFWFFTNEHSEKVDDVSEDNNVSLIYSNPDKGIYLHISGKCKVINDSDKIQELWTPEVKTWFPKGIEDPVLALLKATTQEASYWDNSSGKFIIFE